MGDLFGTDYMKKVEPTFGVSFGLPNQGGGGYPINPFGPNPLLNPYGSNIGGSGINLGLVSINPLVSVQVTKDDYGKKVIKPLVNLHVTPNDFLVHKLENLFFYKKHALYNKHQHYHHHHAHKPYYHHHHHGHGHGHSFGHHHRPSFIEGPEFVSPGSYGSSYGAEFSRPPPGAIIHGSSGPVIHEGPHPPGPLIHESPHYRPSYDEEPGYESPPSSYPPDYFRRNNDNLTQGQYVPDQYAHGVNYGSDYSQLTPASNDPGYLATIHQAFAGVAQQGLAHQGFSQNIGQNLNQQSDYLSPFASHQGSSDNPNLGQELNQQSDYLNPYVAHNGLTRDGKSLNDEKPYDRIGSASYSSETNLGNKIKFPTSKRRRRDTTDTMDNTIARDLKSLTEKVGSTEGRIFEVKY